ncbi:hypothetical protein AB0M95_04120 [Sphaerisporangium sp. NPDC051017]|uniref:hypothetical protein n=1 Tax=Sphaerisporangium sp. NPDC051017 TaxID=3154636 RepID=UPI0034166D79
MTWGEVSQGEERGEKEIVICKECKEGRHEGCRGGSWCDCQHQTTPPPPMTPLAWPRSG